MIQGELGILFLTTFFRFKNENFLNNIKVNVLANHL